MAKQAIEGAGRQDSFGETLRRARRDPLAYGELVFRDRKGAAPLVAPIHRTWLRHIRRLEALQAAHVRAAELGAAAGAASVK